MHAMSIRTGGVSIVVLIITMGFILLASFVPTLLGSCEPFLVLGLMLLIGLPHGATDHALFLALDTSHTEQSKKPNFYLLYALIIAVYGLLWYLLPGLAFIAFILLSIYHFGQSNWADVSYGSKVWSRFHYVLWGSGVLLTPILLHASEANLIVADMTGRFSVLPPPAVFLTIIGILLLANLLFLLLCWQKKIISGRRLLKEILGYFLLLGMFFTNSLLLGFTVYFVFWHSLASVKDQLRFFQARISPVLRRQLYVGILSTVIGALGFCLIIWFGPGPAAALRPSIIGKVFIFIALLTLPHMILVEKLYAVWSPITQRNKPTLEVIPTTDKTIYTNQQPRKTSTSELNFFH